MFLQLCFDFLSKFQEYFFQLFCILQKNRKYSNKQINLTEPKILKIFIFFGVPCKNVQHKMQSYTLMKYYTNDVVRNEQK